MRNIAALALCASAFLLPLDGALAQENRDFRVRVGLGAKTVPKYIGADSSEWAPLFGLSFARGDKPFKWGAPDDSAGIALISAGGFDVGPAANIAGRRKESDVGAPVGTVHTTIEAGGFVQYRAGDSFRIRGELLKGLGGHDGIVGSLGADYILRNGDLYDWSIGPRVLFSNARYQRAYFGVTPEAALASGVPAYRPGSGVHALAATTAGHYRLGGPWGLFGFARYERLVGDAAKSPIVREFGSRNQYSAGAGVTYTFVIKR
jgi:outer membrane protein